MNTYEGIRLPKGDRHLLRLYKAKYDLRSYAEAIRHAIERAEAANNEEEGEYEGY